MKEKDFIDFWKKNIDMGSSLKLCNIKGEEVKIKIFYKGEINKNFGPDIQNVRIVIKNRIYTGDIEFHQYSADWFRHNHHFDERYDDVIMHIVNQNNSKIRIINSKSRRVNTLIIKNIPFKKYKKEDHIKKRLPCYYMLFRKDNNIQRLENIFLDLGINNIRNKIKYILKFYCYYKDQLPDQDLYSQLLFVFIFKGLGYFHNRFNFQNKIKSIFFYRNLAFLKDYLVQAGFKYYGRPNNFPCKRIVQFVSFLKSCEGDIFKKVYHLFRTSIEFGDFTRKITFLFNENLIKSNRISSSTVKIITFNLIMPIFFIYLNLHGHKIGLRKLMDFFLKAEKFEENNILIILNNTLKLDLKYKPSREIFIQGYYYLYHSFCKAKKCENCYLYKKL